ncbi:MAG: exodeoxyribonuclease VII small subunit [Rickettsiales bacterium]|jgi:exodeoxyribonuclease VII small subunit|nr:exodeoxyribonuclease VII small subunit [Rickettsiales bacterium]
MTEKDIKKITKDDIKNMSFEQAMAALDEIIMMQQSGQIPLEESVNIYEIGICLKTHCEDHLKAAKMRVEKISFSENGDIKKEDFK